MKRILLPIVIFSICTLKGISQEAPETQRLLISKITATWCPPCGGWGWDMFKDLIEDNAVEATLMAVHHSGDLETPTSNAFANNFNISGQPRFFVGNLDQSVSSGSAASKRIDIRNQVIAAQSQNPVVNSGILAVHDGANITIKTKTKFFQSTDDNLYLGVYVIDNGYFGFQNSRGDITHEKVLVNGMVDNYFGEVIASGAVAIGTEVEHEYVQAIDLDWDVEKLEIATIIWSENNGTYTYVNSNVTTEINLATSSGDLSTTEFVVNLNPTILRDQAVLNLELPIATNDISIIVSDQLGKRLTDIFSGNLASGQHQFEIGRENFNTAGLYFVTVQTDDTITTKKVLVQ